MSDTDSSSYILRFDLLSNVPQYFLGADWYTFPSNTAGVSSFNTLTGAVTISAGSNITLTPSGNNITIASTGSTTPNISAIGSPGGDSNVNSSAYVATGIQCTITPSSSGAKIVILGTSSSQNVTATGGVESFFTIYRDTTATQGQTVADGTNVALSPHDYISVMYQSVSNAAVSVPVMTLDIPGTGPHTYTICCRLTATGETYDVGILGAIIAFEVH